MRLKAYLSKYLWIFLLVLLIPSSLLMIRHDKKDARPIDTGKAEGLVINEVCVRNAGIMTEYGCVDYIELYNPTEKILDLSGIGLSDYPTQARGVFPAGTYLQPGEIALLPCNCEIVPFGLKAGEILSVFDTDGSLLFKLDIPFLDKNQVILFSEGEYKLSDQATPGFSNDAAGLAAYRASLMADSPFRISELCAANKTLIPGGDWIEIQNLSEESVSTAGLFLTDDYSDLFKYALPAEKAEPGACVLCDISAAFGLSAGETVYLVYNGSVADSLTVLDCESDVTQGTDGLLSSPSPGYPNTKEGSYAYFSHRNGVILSEAMSWNRSFLKGPFGTTHDYIELQNLSETDLDLSLVRVGKSEAKENYSVGEGSLAPGEYFVILCDKDGSNLPAGYPVVPFGISSSGDEIYLWYDGQLTDKLTLPALAADEAYGRSKDFETGILAEASPGKTNGGLRE